MQSFGLAAYRFCSKSRACSALQWEAERRRSAALVLDTADPSHSHPNEMRPFHFFRTRGAPLSNWARRAAASGTAYVSLAHAQTVAGADGCWTQC